jgi:DNA-directed RNA polymerases I, II, and III subunit RPABC1
MSLINKLFTSRSIIIDMIKQRGFDTSKYDNFSIKEIDSMLGGTPAKISSDVNPLDIYLENKNNKIMIKFIVNQKLRINNLTNLVEDIITTQLFTENDTLIIITHDKITNEIFDEFLETIYQKHNIFIQLFWIETLMVDITQHKLVPNHSIVSNEEKEQLLQKYNLVSYSQLPIIMKNDPVAKYYGGKRGDVFKINRPSETAGEYITYRFCQ